MINKSFKFQKVCVLVILSLILPATFSWSADLPKPIHTVTVQGTGKAELAPDIAVIRLGVSQEGPEIPPLEKAVRERMRAMIDKLQSNGVPIRDIQTQSFQVYPKIAWNSTTGSQHRDGYTVSNQIKVTLHQLDKVGELLSLTLDAGANEVNGPEFSLENPSKAEAAALSDAMNNAHLKATTLAHTAGVALGPVISISENTSSFPIRPMFAKAASAPSAEPIEPGQETFTATVTVTFALATR